MWSENVSVFFCHIRDLQPMWHSFFFFFFFFFFFLVPMPFMIFHLSSSARLLIAAFIQIHFFLHFGQVCFFNQTCQGGRSPDRPTRRSVNPPEPAESAKMAEAH